MIQIIQHDSLTSWPVQDQSVDCIIMDPPYDLTEAQKTFVQSEALRVCKGDLLVFSPPENEWVFPDLTRKLFWIKPTSTKNYSKNYGRFVEMIFLYKRNKVWNSTLMWHNYTGVYLDTLVEPRVHEFQKPSSLLERFIHIHTNKGDLILDPFAGSGSTLRAAERLERRTMGFDSNPVWCV